MRQILVGRWSTKKSGPHFLQRILHGTNSWPPSVDEPIRDEARAEFNQPWNFGDSLLQR